MPFLVHRLGRECQSFDDLLTRVVPVALEVHISIPMMLGYGEVNPNFDLIVVGWSTRKNQAQSFLVTPQRDDREDSRKTWQFVELPDVLIAPPVDMAQIQFLNWQVPTSAEAFQPDTDGVKLLEAQRLSQRRLNVGYADENIGFTVGGFIQLTSVSPRGVSSSVLHRWPDQAGQKIEVG